jgi:murein L,D-transpeptidase YcbB/YkuD
MRLKPIITLQAGAAALLLAACAQTQPVREVPVAAETVPVVTGPAPAESGAEEQVWSDENFDKLLAALRGLSSHGLTPEDYDLDTLEAERGDKAERDRLATAAWQLAASHLLQGKLDPVSMEANWTIPARQDDIAARLAGALETGEIAATLEALAPQQPVYQLMRTELAAQEAKEQAPIVAVEDGPALKPGMSGPRVAALRARLVQLGLLEEEAESDLFDDAAKTALEALQADAGLDVDGVAGDSTLRALNQGTAERIAQLRVNLERWRWLPDTLGRRHLRANIAAFDVTAFEDGAARRTYLTIVGKPYRRTPVFSDEIEYIVFNPWWETPDSLARSDKLPLFQKDPGAVERLGFQVLDRSGNVVDPAGIDWTALKASTFPYRLRQAPGPLNALGQVKIMFPNPYNVYLHDTPSRGLFAEQQRAFSSGCLRTQYPIELSKWLLSETPGWDSAAVDAAVASGKETRADLAARVPVYILYLTTVSDGAGGVRYLDDIYGRDAAVLAALDTPPGQAVSPAQSR